MVAVAPSSFAGGGCNECYAITTYGIRAGAKLPSNAAGVDLEVSCLSVGDRINDFANWEAWQGTNNNISAWDYWVEEGMTAGTVWDGGQPYTGFEWFWADMRPHGGDYNEHFLGDAATGGWTNVSFYWLGDGNWDVLIDGFVVGESTYSGDNSYGGDAGAETTTTNATVEGQLDNYQYEDPNGNWHGVKPNLEFTEPYPWFGGYAAPGSITGAYAFVNTGCGAKASRMNAAWRSHAKPISPADAPTILRATALGVAAQNGEAHPTGLAYVKGTRHQAASLMDTSVTEDDASYIIQMHGHFTSYRSGRAGSKARPTGNTMLVVVSATTGQVTDISISNSVRSLIDIAEPRAL